MSLLQLRLACAAITATGVALVALVSLNVGLTAWWAALLALGYRELRRPGERFRDYLVRCGLTDKGYDCFRALALERKSGVAGVAL